MKNVRYSQQGMGMIQILILLIMFGAVLTVGFKLFPPYMEQMTLAGILDRVSTNPEYAGKSSAQIRKQMNQQLYLDGVKSLEGEKFKKRTRFFSEQGKRMMRVKYSDVVPLFANLSLLVTFDKTIELPKKS